MEPSIKETILALGKKVQSQRIPISFNIPSQYPSMNTRDVTAHMVTQLANIQIDDMAEDTDDEAINTSMLYMVCQTTVPDITIRAHLEYAIHPWYPSSIYAIADGGADSCIVGKHAHVLSYTGRYANLVGYNPETTRTDKVPIVTALLKARSNENDYPILLRGHEAPYNTDSPITLFSEYQIHE